MSVNCHLFYSLISVVDEDSATVVWFSPINKGALIS